MSQLYGTPTRSSYFVESIEKIQWRAARWVTGNYHWSSSVSDMIMALNRPTLEQHCYNSRLIMFYRLPVQTLPSTYHLTTVRWPLLTTLANSIFSTLQCRGHPQHIIRWVSSLRLFENGTNYPTGLFNLTLSMSFLIIFANNQGWTYTYSLFNFIPHPPPPGRVGEYRGFDKLSCQVPHPWGQVSCQIPIMSPSPRRGFDNTFRLSIVLL